MCNALFIIPAKYSFLLCLIPTAAYSFPSSLPPYFFIFPLLLPLLFTPSLSLPPSSSFSPYPFSSRLLTPSLSLPHSSSFSLSSSSFRLLTPSLPLPFFHPLSLLVFLLLPYPFLLPPSSSTSCLLTPSLSLPPSSSFSSSSSSLPSLFFPYPSFSFYSSSYSSRLLTPSLSFPPPSSLPFLHLRETPIMIYFAHEFFRSLPRAQISDAHYVRNQWRPT